MGSCSADEVAAAAVVMVVECRCCGMREECTSGYVARVQERFGGVWLCGLCEEAVKDEQARLGGAGEVGLEAAMRVHATFRRVAAVDPALRFARSILALLRKMTVPTPPSPASPLLPCPASGGGAAAANNAAPSIP